MIAPAPQSQPVEGGEELPPPSPFDPAQVAEMRPANHPNRSIRGRAVRFAMDVILRSTDWQEVQDALANHAEFGPWLGDEVSGYQSIIREAEGKLGSKMPSNYG